MRLLTSLLALTVTASALFGADNAVKAEQPLSHFVWGADIGGAIDMSGHDMSTVNIDATFGYRGGIFNTLGIGAGINITVSNSRHEFPVYAIARTSFSTKPQPVFGELRTGIVVNTHPDNDSSTDFFISPGLGFRLATGKTFCSYLVIGYIYNGLRTEADSGTGDDLSNRIRGINSAVVRFGVYF